MHSSQLNAHASFHTCRRTVLSYGATALRSVFSTETCSLYFLEFFFFFFLQEFDLFLESNSWFSFFEVLECVTLSD